MGSELRGQHPDSGESSSEEPVERAESNDAGRSRPEVPTDLGPSGMVTGSVDDLSDEEIVALAREHQRLYPRHELGFDAPGPALDGLDRMSAAQVERWFQSVPDDGEAGLDRRVGDGLDAPTAREVLGRYAGGDGLTVEQEAADWEYVQQYQDDRPWLKAAADVDPLVRHVICDRDRSGGHDLQRHDGWRDDQAQADRVQHGKDPAHPTDSAAYHASTDAIRGSESLPDDPRQREKEQHRVGACATRISNPTEYAVAVARIYEDPRVKEVLATEPTDKQPKAISDLRIEDVLGPDGDHACEGYRLSSDEFPTMSAARKNSSRWNAEIRAELAGGAIDREDAAEKVRGRAAAGTVDAIEPNVEGIESFKGGTFTVAFRRKHDDSGFEIATLYPCPPRDESGV